MHNEVGTCAEILPKIVILKKDYCWGSTKSQNPETMQSHLNLVYSAKTLIITHSGVNACPLGTAENIIG